jgi:hypothetical protein
MIALSSFRPFSKCSPERCQQYVQSHASWDRVFDRIVYFNTMEPSLVSNKTGFIGGTDERPKISLMAEHASLLKTWVAIINADITVLPKLIQVPMQLHHLHGVCAISRRFDAADPSLPLDWGIDFFLATAEVWKTVAFQIPTVFTLGRVRFDTWLCSFFSRQYATQCFDLTPSKLIFHPTHEERIDQHVDEPEDFYLKCPAYPKKRLTI